MEQQFLENLLKLVSDASFIAFAVPTVVVLTAILKRVFQGVNANVLRLVSQVAVWVLYKVALELGYGHQFEALLPAITTIAGALLGGIVSEIGAAKLYSAAQKAQIAVVGYKRSD